MAAPVPRIGERWVYREINEYNKSTVGQLERVVTSLAPLTVQQSRSETQATPLSVVKGVRALTFDGPWSVLIDASFDVIARRNFKVECRQLERSINGLQLDACKDRACWTCIDDPRGPCDSVRKRGRVHFDFHASSFRLVFCGYSSRTFRSDSFVRSMPHDDVDDDT